MEGIEPKSLQQGTTSLATIYQSWYELSVAIVPNYFQISNVISSKKKKIHVTPTFFEEIGTKFNK